MGIYSIMESKKNIFPINKNKRIFHGSTIQNLKTIKPNNSRSYADLGPIVFGSTREEFAATFCIKWRDTDLSLGTSSDNDEKTNDSNLDKIYLWLKNKDLDFDKPCSIYELENNEFNYLRYDKDLEVYSNKEAKVLKEYKFKSFREVINKFGIEVHDYESKASFNESYIISGDDIIQNFDKWKKGESNILYVTGLSGSGKTTLGEEYASKYKAKLFEIDGIEHVYDSSNSDILEKVKHKFPEYGIFLRKVKRNSTFSTNQITKVMTLLKDILLYIIFEMEKDKNTLYIIEGIQIFQWLDPDTLKGKPLIIKGTSMTKSIIQRFKRNGGGKIDWIAELRNEFPNLVKWYIDDEKDLCKFKKEVKEESTMIKKYDGSTSVFILTEADSERKYKCPLCDYRDTRENLVSHINDEHEDMIPQGFTAARLVFNSINKKQFGRCVICTMETDWNEEVWRYERLCKMKKCHDTYVSNMKSNMIKVHGAPHILNNPEQQKKMLSGRSISGEYKFQDGGVRSYCGSYEKKLLEFYDKVMNVPSKDILTPGPNIEYEFQGKKHIWITDIYYIPANLVHDVKDGGDNPNNRDMGDYRAKQDAKEDAIKVIGTYNYIRLTDNNFQQLILILAELKHQMIDNDGTTAIPALIRINEEVGGLPMNKPDAAYIIPYMNTTTFTDGVMISRDTYMRDMLKIEDDKIQRATIDDLEECKYNMYKYAGDAKAIFKSINSDMKEKTPIDNKYYFYTKLTDKPLLNIDQIAYDTLFTECIDAYIDAVVTVECTQATIEDEYNKCIGKDNYIRLTDMKDLVLEKQLLRDKTNLCILQDINGYFIQNSVNESRSKSYPNIQDIPEVVINKLA